MLDDEMPSKRASKRATKRRARGRKSESKEGKREFICLFGQTYEAKLFLNVTHDYKIQQVNDDMCWESVKHKYVDILEI